MLKPWSNINAQGRKRTKYKMQYKKKYDVKLKNFRKKLAFYIYLTKLMVTNIRNSISPFIFVL